jgi:hypothetical protein
MAVPITVKITDQQLDAASQYEQGSGLQGMRYGKLGEYCVIDYLRRQNISLREDTTPMDRPDYYDINSFHSLIDVKTATKPSVKAIHITKSTFDRGRRFEFYIGVQLDMKHGKAYIYGYATKKDIEHAKFRKAGMRYAYYILLKDMRPIQELVAYLKKSYRE